MKYIKLLIVSFLLSALTIAPAFGAITSVTVTPAPATTLSNGNSYYLAGVAYAFRIQAVDPAATDAAYWNQIILLIREGAIIRETVTIDVETAAVVGLPTGLVVDSITNNTAVWTNLDYTITVRFRWDCVEFAAGANNVRGYVSEDGGSNLTDTKNFPFGVCSSVRVTNFLHSGVAADGRINPWHEAFNVTGAIIYNVTGAGIADRVETVDPGETGVVTLLIDGAPTALADGNAGADVSFPVTADFFAGYALGNHTWRLRVVMNTAPLTEDSVAASDLTINNDRVEITGITFINGGGVDVPNYYRSTIVPGTQIRVQARMQNGLGPMVGNTNITVRNITDAVNLPVPVQILDGQTVGIVNVPGPVVGAGTTVPKTYRIEQIYGGAYGGDLPFPPRGQSDNTRIVQPANPVVYWDNSDPPGNNGAPFTAWGGYSSTAYSISPQWTALDAALPDYDGDFYTYRVYYRVNSGPGPWIIIDRNVAGYAALGIIATNTMDITGLNPLTEYDVYVTAVDYFGQEVSAVNATPNASPGITINTRASSVSVTLTDGITVYENTQFERPPAPTPADALARPMRKTAAKVDLYIVTTGAQPDLVNIILRPFSVFPADPFYSLGTLNGVDGTDYYRIRCVKSSPNIWTGFIPETNPLISYGTSSRFIIETFKGGVASYSDNDSDLEAPPGEVNNYPWSFVISTPTTFTPWPTRILNNVINDKNPIAYPAFYLSEDAYVTIKIYDIKGRPVVTLLDASFRKGGQNIKEEGWDGRNKSNRKVGVGLYYVHIRAKSASSGKVILNSFQKVVMAR